MTSPLKKWLSHLMCMNDENKWYRSVYIDEFVKKGKLNIWKHIIVI